MPYYLNLAFKNIFRQKKRSFTLGVNYFVIALLMLYEPVKRLVALKLIKSGVNSKAVLALFEALPADSPFLALDPLQRQGALASHMQAGDPLLQEPQGTAGVELIIREGINAVGQAHQPAAFHVAGRQLGRHAEGFEHGEVERCPSGEARQNPLDYLKAHISTHGLNILRNLISAMTDRRMHQNSPHG